MSWITFLIAALMPVVISFKRNVVFIIVDDLRPNLGCYNYESAVTPNLDELASKSFVFKRAYCQQALCAPSRNSFLTSRRPDTLKLYDFYNYWRETVGNFTTLPQHFKDNGYFTYSIGKVFHPGKSSNFSDDFPYSWSQPPFWPKTEKYKNSKVCSNSDGSLSKNLLCPVRVDDQPEGTLPDLESLNSALNFLKYHPKDRPFFLAIGFHKPHIPFKFPEKYLEKHPLNRVKVPSNYWRPYAMPQVAWNPWIDIRKREDIKNLNISLPFGKMPTNFVKRIIQHYNAAVTYIDDLIGQILKVLHGSNSIIIVTSDHGWSAGEHGEFSKYSNFDISTRVPLIIHVPRLSTSEIIVEQLVELVDLFPTLVDLTQISSSLPVCGKNSKKSQLCTEGKSLLPIMLNAKNKNFATRNFKEAVFSQFPRPGIFPTKIPNSDEPKLDEIKIMGYSMKTETHRYSEWVEFNKSVCKPNWMKSFGRELYDHRFDSDENLNLVDRKELNELANSLRKRLILGWKYA